jgi:hypothetical protein
MNTLMDPVFAMDETFFSSRGSRLDQLRNALELTTITPRAHIRGQRSFDRQSSLLPLLGRCRTCPSTGPSYVIELRGFDRRRRLPAGRHS